MADLTPHNARAKQPCFTKQIQKKCIIADVKKIQKSIHRMQARGKNNKAIDHALEKTTAQINASIQTVIERKNHQLDITYPPHLPISGRVEEIKKIISENQVTILSGHTGSGKSTQIPKICLSLGLGLRGYIGHTQPRRIAARSIASRLKQELSAQSSQVAFKIRFDDKSTDQTLVKVITDGVLLAETQSDPLLLQYQTLIIDEAHERSLNIDFLLGYLKKILPKRPDLKIIITSATIDTKQFSAFFNDAPVIEVRGQTYPVEVRYQPLSQTDSQPNSQDVYDAIAQATDQLLQETSGGDILVFLSGEKEIRDTAKTLSYLGARGLAVLPLYARLPAAQQNLVFKSTPHRRVILATNVAETSLTVPGIRFVIDTGVARISRFSAKANVQRLPIEKISQASANQRKGRCGRVADGICIRLYDRADFQNRDLFTQPEIQRTHLASVILQMKSLGLGNIQDFDFLDPPKYAMIRQGLKLLFQLNAIDLSHRITAIGRQIARIPIDPRTARMLLASVEEGCIDDMLIIASGLTIQDPRQRPEAFKQQADAAHEPFTDGQSDFISILKLWDFSQKQSKQLSQSKLRKACSQNFLSYLTMREWYDLYRQLREIMIQQHGRFHKQRAEPENIHRAILSGLLYNVGNLSEHHQYQGTNNLKFSIFPGSALFSKKPKWLMSSQIVETTRLYARTNAAISPQWIEPIAGHVVHKSQSNPRWDVDSAKVLADEKVSLFSLVIIPKRTVHYGAIDIPKAREIFIHHALVEMDYHSHAPFHKHNVTLVEEIKLLQEKIRRSDLLEDLNKRYAFFDQLIPADITNGPAFEQWRKKQEYKSPKLLFLSPEILLPPELQRLKATDHPDTLKIANTHLNLTYKHDYTHQADGVTLNIPIEMLNQVRESHTQQLVPGFLGEKITILIKHLPKAIRVDLIPISQTVEACLEQLQDSKKPFIQALHQILQNIAQQSFPQNLLDETKLPKHLQLNLNILDKQGQTITQSRDLHAVTRELSDQIKASFQTIEYAGVTREKITKWDFGDLPKQVHIKSAGLDTLGYPCIVDHQKSVSIELRQTQDAADALTRIGVRRLLCLELSTELKHQAKQIAGLDRLAVSFATLGNKKQLTDHLLTLIVQQTFLSDAPAITTQKAYERCIEAGWNKLTGTNQLIAKIVKQILVQKQVVDLQLDKSHPRQFKLAVDDIRWQRQNLFCSNFLIQTPFAWLCQYPRYLKAISQRIEKLYDGHFQRDRERFDLLQPYLHDVYQMQLKALEQNLPNPENQTLRWMLEEYRVDLFAQSLGTSIPISVNRIDKQLKKSQNFNTTTTIPEAEASSKHKGPALAKDTIAKKSSNKIDTPLNDSISGLLDKFSGPF